MKKIMTISVFLVIALIVVGCANGAGGSSDGSDSLVPAVFVRVEGTTVTGNGKYNAIIDNETFTGVFVSGRTVEVSTFYMSDHEVTQAEYESVIGTNPSSFKGKVNRPVEHVCWYDAIVYCNKKSLADGLNPCYTINNSTNPTDWGVVPSSSNSTWNAVVCDFTKNGYRLPTEIEWEYAARGGADGVALATQYKYAGTTDNLSGYAWYSINSDNTTHEVKKKTPNSLGIYDLTGNLYEYCWDWFNDNDTINSNTPVTGATSGTGRICRGGCWREVYEKNCLVAKRHSYDPSNKSASYHGFRVVRTSL